jgi:hypothetical protein
VIQGHHKIPSVVSGPVKYNIAISASAAEPRVIELRELVARLREEIDTASNYLEVLAGRRKARRIYDEAGQVARFAERCKAAKEIVESARRAQADAIELETTAARRLADEYDAAQARGAIKKAGNPNSSGAEELPGAREFGLSHKEVHEARQLRDAENRKPGSIRGAIDNIVSEGRAPTRAALMRDICARSEDKVIGLVVTKVPSEPRVTHVQVTNCAPSGARKAAQAEALLKVQDREDAEAIMRSLRAIGPQITFRKDEIRDRLDEQFQKAAKDEQELVLSVLSFLRSLPFSEAPAAPAVGG